MIPRKRGVRLDVVADVEGILRPDILAIVHLLGVYYSASLKLKSWQRLEN